MIGETLSFWSRAKETLLGDDSARRLAAGVALGMIIGLLPKDSILVGIFFLILMVTTANLLCALVSGFVFSWVGALLDPISHRLGTLALTQEQLEPMWAWLYDLPLMPWTRFNNTVVMGSLLLGIFLFYPTYRISFSFFQRYGAALHRRLQKTFWYRWLVAPPQMESEAIG